MDSSKGKHYLVVGDQAVNPIVSGGGSGHVDPGYVLPPLWAICDELGVRRIDNHSIMALNRRGKNGNRLTYVHAKHFDLLLDVVGSFKFDVKLLFLGSTSTEGGDRDTLDWTKHEKKLIDKVAGLKHGKFVVHMTTPGAMPVSYTHLRAHETGRNLVCRLLLEKKNN